MSSAQKLIGLSGVVAVGIVAAALSGVFNNQFTDGGVDVRDTACEELASARQAISDELSQRKQSAVDTHAQQREVISDAYWEKNRALESEYHQCISNALTADPCKEPFEEVSRLYEEIMAQFNAGEGFNEAKATEREVAKQKYNECVEQAKKPEAYEGRAKQCEETLAREQAANQADREAKEVVAQEAYDAAIQTAKDAYAQKSAILDAIEEKCNQAGEEGEVIIGSLTTGGTGTKIQDTSSACTGAFKGNDPDLERRISDLENQINKAKAAGMRGGLFGIDHLQQALDELRQELNDSERSCTIDADCGNTEPVCCSNKQVGRAVCRDNVCVSEKTDCTDPEICAGKPAMCVAPSTGVQQQDGVYISRTIPEKGACSQNLQVLTLAQSSEDSVRYSIVGNIPNWLHLDAPSGKLPAKVTVTYSCDTVQDFGPGNYPVNGSITVYNGANELINTIPFNVSITVTAVAPELIEAIEYNGKYLPVSQLIIEDEIGCGVDHWHAKSGAVTATDGSTVMDPGPQCGFGKTSERPVKKVPATTQAGVKGEVRGLESLKTR